MESKEENRSPAWIEAHNAEARAVWEAFHAGRPARPPVALGTNARFFIFNEELNPGEQVTFEGTIARIHAHRRFFGLDEVAPDLFFADDAIQMISGEMLVEFLLPVYRKLKAALTTAERIKIHLCGDATRHFRLLKEELGVYDFETGYPVDFGWLRRELGPEVTIHGGPSAIFLQQATPEEVQTETERILNSGICDGRRFVLREGNNLAPGTPRANLEAMYETARAWSPPGLSS